MKDGSTVVGAKQNFSNRVFSKGQLTHQSRFQKAAVYARVAVKTNLIYAELAQGTIMTASKIALSDWLNPSVIHGVHRLGKTIQVEATDNVTVAKVCITLLGEEGKYWSREKLRYKTTNYGYTQQMRMSEFL